MARNNPAPNLIAEIDTLEAKLEARLADFVAEERAKEGGTTIPEGVHRNLLLRNSGNFFASMRRLLIEREMADAHHG